MRAAVLCLVACALFAAASKARAVASQIRPLIHDAGARAFRQLLWLGRRCPQPQGRRPGRPGRVPARACAGPVLTPRRRCPSTTLRLSRSPERCSVLPTRAPTSPSRCTAPPPASAELTCGLQYFSVNGSIVITQLTNTSDCLGALLYNNGVDPTGVSVTYFPSQARPAHAR
jgi:hypothetical protein